MLQLFDSHCHLDGLGDKLPGVLERAAAAGVVGMATIGCDWESSQRASELAAAYDNITCAVGFHPSDSHGLDDKRFIELGELASRPEVRAVGEIGLDYYWDSTPRDIQQKWFVEQIHLARDLHKPIVIHDREAHGDLFDIVRRENAGEFGGIMHCFSGSWELAKEALRMNFYISFAGPLTYKNARALPEVAAQCPLDRILIETDTPYLAPEPLRGKSNEPANVRYVAAKLAEIRGLDIEEIGAAVTRNARLFYGLAE